MESPTDRRWPDHYAGALGGRRDDLGHVWRPLRRLARLTTGTRNGVRRRLGSDSLPVGIYPSVFWAGVDLLLRSERRTGLEMGHAGRCLCRRQHSSRLTALFALPEIRARLQR